MRIFAMGWQSRLSLMSSAASETKTQRQQCSRQHTMFSLNSPLLSKYMRVDKGIPINNNRHIKS